MARKIFALKLREYLIIPDLSNENLKSILPAMVLDELKFGNPEITEVFESEEYGDINSADYIDPISENETILEIVAAFDTDITTAELAERKNDILHKLILQFESGFAYFDTVWEIASGDFVQAHILFENVPPDIC